MGVIGVHGHKIKESKMTQGEYTEVNSEDQRCRP